ncbi:MAG: hypothetical protein A2660_00095 [Candidatus Doudnabacteria bacterium RIFCSPHIGHO2_01_FULL_45_18]|uniref:Uncharacterized protein n=1 Tax=Candidatus Doudnabacteria bacterium RIFCSPHIGHO2_01_FULL_45_18 TaxID=1817823 RepID=A0A1F5NSA7_9BACT|nr:MAG: hypothetical protein A2660_00095 [Candidatus Doudnabacteria bacterium RIFCSPHIGHO2_01_FULL_45_18]
MIYYLLIIFLLTLVFWVLYRSRIIAFCPICAVTVITWVGGLLAIHLRVSWANPFVVAILMGASMGALAEKYGRRFGLLWKTAMILLGISSIYFLVQPDGLYEGLGITTVLLGITFFSHKGTPAEHVRGDLFKDCC